MEKKLGETEMQPATGTGKSAVKVPRKLESDFVVFLGDRCICLPFAEMYREVL